MLRKKIETKDLTVIVAKNDTIEEYDISVMARDYSKGKLKCRTLKRGDGGIEVLCKPDTSKHKKSRGVPDSIKNRKSRRRKK